MTKILLVEDDLLMARTYQKIFTFENYDVVLAADGEEALERVRTETPALILLDVMMPKLNGMQVLQKLKQDPAMRKIPVVMLTNLAEEHDAETALAHGAVRYIIKSEYEPKEVVAIVKEILAGYPRGEVSTTS